MITADLVEKNIGISKEYNNFELVNASLSPNIKVEPHCEYFGQNKKNNPLVLTISILFNFFTNLLHYHRLADESQFNVALELGINPFL